MERARRVWPARGPGTLVAMADQDPEGRMEDTAAELDDRIDKLGEHLDEARHKAEQVPAGDEAPGSEVVGDFEDTEGGPMFGEDPVGAADEQGDTRER